MTENSDGGEPRRPETLLSMPTAPRDGWMDHLAAVHTVEFNQLSIAISVSASATPIILGYLYGLPDSCGSIQESGITRNLQTGEPIACIADGAYLALPLAPLSILLFYCYLFLNARLVGKYSRALERAISAQDEQAGTHEKLTFPALSRLNGALYGGESKKLMPFRIMFVFFATTLFVIEVFTIFFLSARIHDPNLREIANIGYGMLVLVCSLSFVVGASHSGWDDLKVEALRREILLGKESIREYSWGSYLWDAIAPRLASLAKAIDLVPLVIALIVFRIADPAHALWSLVGMLAYDLILYQTRYFMNAARELTDRAYGLPGDVRNNSMMPWTPFQRLLAPVMVVARIGIFAVVAIHFKLLSEQATWALVACFLVVFYAYEIPREVARRRHRSAIDKAVKQCDHESTSDVAACRLEHIAAQTRAALTGRWGRTVGGVLFVTVGAGYALRAGLFVHLAAPDLLASWWGVCIVALSWALGSAQVALGWAVEFLGARAKDRPAYSVGVLAKPQLSWAARHLDRERFDALVPTVVTLKESRANESADWVGDGRPLRPWDLAGLFSGTLVLLLPAVHAASSLTWLGAVAAAAVFVGLRVKDLHRGASSPSVDASPPDSGSEDAQARPPATGWTLWAWLAVCLGCGVTSALGAGWPTMLATGALLFWTCFKLDASRRGTLYGLIKSAKKLRERLAAIPKWVAKVVLGLLEFVLGFPVVHAFQGRFGNRRNSWI